MSLKLHLSDIEEIVFESGFPRKYQDLSSRLQETDLNFDHRLGLGTYKEIYFDGIHIAFGDLRFKSPVSLEFETDFETVEMHFNLSGHSSTSLAGNAGMGYSFDQHSHNIIYVPGVKGQLHARQGFRMMEINMQPFVFEKYLEGSDLHKSFLLGMRHQNPALMASHNLPITPDMMRLINEIMDCTLTGLYKRLYLEARVIELLLLQLEQFAAHDCKVFCNLKSTDIEKMHHARQIIKDRLHNPCSLIDLAKLIGTNEFTLKKGFKEVFGTTVFGMVADQRLQQAKEQLLAGTKNIAEISYDAGYKNPTHFSAAFKRKFGVSPSAYVMQMK